MLLTALISPVFSQLTPEYSMTFEGILDNREFAGSHAKAQTILGARAAFELGHV
jgi:hypothetical protein